MRRRALEHWSDAIPFRVALVMSGCIVMPVLLLGIFVSVGMLANAIDEQTANLPGAIVVALSLGGAVGVLGWLRAHYEVKARDAQDPTVTFVCLGIGTATASAVAAIPIVVTLMALRDELEDVWPLLLLACAPAVWALYGVASLQKLARAYAELTGRGLDGMPALMLIVAILLVAATILISTSL